MMTRHLAEFRQEAILYLWDKHGVAFFALEKETQERIICETITEALKQIRARD